MDQRVRLTTSRYQNADGIACAGAHPVGITRGRPRFRLPYTPTWCRALAPSRATFAREGGEFVASYVAQLDVLGVDGVRAALVPAVRDAAGRPLALLCFEDLRLGLGCHRRLLARWWEAATGEAVPELDDLTTPRPSRRGQGRLLDTD